MYVEWINAQLWLIYSQVGQCGNQLGATLFDSLYDHAESYPHLSIETGCNPFLRPATAEDNQSSSQSKKQQAKARAVLIDTEPKVCIHV